MAFALVGTIGAATQGAVSASVTPAWGTGENRTAGNLLICFVSVSASNTLPTTPSGWTIAKQVANASGLTSGATIYYKIAAGTDAAPTITGITNSVISAQLAEFSGNTATPLDQTGSATGTVSTTATFAAPDTAAGELILMAGTDTRSTTVTPSDTWTSNNATITQAGNNNGVSSGDHYSFGYSLATTSNSAADTAILTLSTTVNTPYVSVVGATFKAAPSAKGNFFLVF